MHAKDLMTKEIAWIVPQTSLREAAGKMKALDVGVLPVCDGQKLVGMLTDRDIVLRSTAEGKDPNSAKVTETMSSKVEFCLEDEDINKVAHRMEKNKIRRLPVIDYNKKLVGIISLGDLAIRGGQKVACEVLEKVSTPNK